MTRLFEEVPAPADEEVPVRRVTVTVNGERRAADVEPRLLLAHLLRQGFGLTGTHTGCDTTSCGACTVLVDGQPVKSCTMLAVQADGHGVTTVEGLAGPSGESSVRGSGCGRYTAAEPLTSTRGVSPCRRSPSNRWWVASTLPSNVSRVCCQESATWAEPARW